MSAYELPIEKFLVTKTKEHFPDFDLRQGTAFRDMVIKPNVMFLQPYRDQANILKRNQSLQNFELMINEEMDSLTANLFSTRRGGGKSEGTVRIYMSEPQPITLTVDMEFRTADGLIFFPKTTSTFTVEEILLNLEGLFYFVDIIVEAEKEGTKYNIKANSIVFTSGAPEGVIRVDNLADFSLGIDSETNAELKNRTELGIAVRDLVIKKSIQFVLLEEFTSLKEVVPIGYGDIEMERDVIPVILDLLILLDTSTAGEIQAPGNTFIDTTGLNFHNLGVRPGHVLQILDSPDNGEYPIESVTSSTITINSNLTVRTGILYGIDGIVKKDDYHIGGKVDVYLDSKNIQIAEVVLSPAQEINDISDIDPGYYEGGIVFTLPVIGIKKISEIDPATREELIVLDEGIDYKVNSLNKLLRYSVQEKTTLQLLETDPLAARYFIGSILKIEYYKDSSVFDVQNYIDNLLNRVITADIIARRAVPAFVDITMDYKGNVEETVLVSIINEYINDLNIGESLQASDLVATVYFFAVDFVSLAFTMNADIHLVDGSINNVSSDTEIIIDRTVKFIPRDIIVNKVL